MRTIKEALNEIRHADPGTSITEHMLRRLILDNAIPSVKLGGKHLIDLDKLYDYLSGQDCGEGAAAPSPRIRKIEER